MVELKLSVASSQQVATNNAELIVEVGLHHVALLVLNNSTIIAFELFEVENSNNWWDKIFELIASQSNIMGKGYSNTKVYMNTAEALVIPAEKFRKESIEPFLSAIYGNADNTFFEADIVKIPNNPAAIYRWNGNLNDALKKHFGTITFRHTYSKILENLLGDGSRMVLEMLKVQFYAKTFTVTVVYGNKLMLLQTYNYYSPEDVIYYLLNIVQEFSLNVQSTAVEVSGMLDISSKHFELLENVFGRLSLETITSDSIFKQYLNVANAHYYTPFYNLSLNH